MGKGVDKRGSGGNGEKKENSGARTWRPPVARRLCRLEREIPGGWNGEKGITVRSIWEGGGDGREETGCRSRGW